MVVEAGWVCGILGVEGGVLFGVEVGGAGRGGWAWFLSGAGSGSLGMSACLLLLSHVRSRSGTRRGNSYAAFLLELAPARAT